jgi:FOG: FHA domain
MLMRLRFPCLLWFMISLGVLTYPAAAEDKLEDPALQAIQALEGGGAEAESAAPAPSPDLTAAPETEAATSSPPVEEPAPPATEIVTTATVPAAKDIVLVLDNSGSMKKNDPQFLNNQAVSKFIHNLDTSTHLAIIIFDQDVRMAISLTEINDATRDGFLRSLEQINYKGLFTNFPAAIERAIYELKTNGRADVKKSIVFMTDGDVDTGDPERDVELANWLKKELAEDAKASGIAISGIAFTGQADFQLIQSIAVKTGGEYYRALAPEDLEGVYDKVQELISKVEEPEPEVVAPPPPPFEAPKPAEPAPPPAPIIVEVPAQPAVSEREKMGSIMMIAALSVMIIAVIFLVLVLIRGSRKKTVADVEAPEAYLNDLNGYTSQPAWKLGSSPAMLGRVAGTDSESLNYIVIPQTTIGRRHALIEYKDFSFWIIDQGSINGTFVNNQIITGETRLKHGDKIRLHKYEFEFAMPEMGMRARL